MTEPKTTTKPSKGAIARHLIMSVRTLRRLVEENKLPASGTLDEYRFAYLTHLREVAAGRAARSGGADLVGERALLAKRQRERVEFDLDVRRGAYELKADATRELEALLYNLKEHFLSFAALVSPDLLGLTSINVAHGIVDARMRRLMDDFANEAEKLESENKEGPK